MKYVSVVATSILAVSTFSSCAACADGLSLNAFSANDRIYLVMENGGERAIKVRGNFLLDSAMGNLSISITQGNRAFPLLGHAEFPMPDETQYMSLSPAALRGRVYDLSSLAQSYGLKEGCYQFVAVYHDLMAADFSAYSGQAASAPIRVCVNEFTSSELLTVDGAQRVAHRALGEGFTGVDPAPSSGHDDGGGRLLMFTGTSPAHSKVAILVHRVTREVWVVDSGRCTKYVRSDLPAAYMLSGKAPAGCTSSSTEMVRYSP